MGDVTLVRDCPHCTARNSSFTSIGCNFIPEGISGQIWNVFMACNGCFGGIVVKLEDRYRENGPLAGNVSRLDWAEGIEILVVYPTATVSEAPADIPQRIGEVFCEASDNVHAGRFETAAMLCRKTMDLATKALRGEVAKAEQLYARIEALRDCGTITSDMSQWAHAVRLDGRDAVHDEDPFTKAEADDMLQFTRAFLMYSFTLPAMVSKRSA